MSDAQTFTVVLPTAAFELTQTLLGHNDLPRGPRCLARHHPLGNLRWNIPVDLPGLTPLGHLALVSSAVSASQSTLALACLIQTGLYEAPSQRTKRSIGILTLLLTMSRAKRTLTSYLSLTSTLRGTRIYPLRLERDHLFSWLTAKVLPVMR